KWLTGIGRPPSPPERRAERDQRASMLKSRLGASEDRDRLAKGLKPIGTTVERSLRPQSDPQRPRRAEPAAALQLVIEQLPRLARIVQADEHLRRPNPPLQRARSRDAPLSHRPATLEQMLARLVEAALPGREEAAALQQLGVEERPRDLLARVAAERQRA